MLYFPPSSSLYAERGSSSEAFGLSTTWCRAGASVSSVEEIMSSLFCIGLYAYRCCHPLDASYDSPASLSHYIILFFSLSIYIYSSHRIAFSHALRLHPYLTSHQLQSGMEVESTSMAEDLKRQGNQLMKETDWRGARELYTRAITIAPGMATYYSNRFASSKRHSINNKTLFLFQFFFLFCLGGILLLLLCIFFSFLLFCFRISSHPPSHFFVCVFFQRGCLHQAGRVSGGHC